MTAAIMNLDKWLQLTGNAVSGDELAPQTAFYDGQLWQRVAEEAE